jgi:hypothetical protein
MLSERDIEAAHPDAFDFVWGNLPAAKQAEFNRHLSDCRYCHAVVTEYSEIGRIIKLLPPYVEPSADLEDRTVAAMVAALADQRAGPARPADTEDRTATRVYPIPQRQAPAEPETEVQPIPPPRPRAGDDTGLRPSPAGQPAALDEQPSTTDRRPDAEDRAATRVHPIPQRQPPAEPETEVQPIPPPRPRAGDDTRLRPSPAGQPAPIEPQARPAVTPLPIWRRYPRRLAAAVAVAAAIIAAAIVIPLSLGRGGLAEVVTFHLTPPPGSTQTASGTAVARPDASGSWTITLTVRHLKTFGDSPWYECWYVGADKAGHPQVASAGTFLVPDSGSGTFSMTSAADPRQFKTMQIRLEQPNTTGAIQGPVVLSATGKTA